MNLLWSLWHGLTPAPNAFWPYLKNDEKEIKSNREGGVGELIQFFN